MFNEREIAEIINQYVQLFVIIHHDTILMTYCNLQR